METMSVQDIQDEILKRADATLLDSLYSARALVYFVDSLNDEIKKGSFSLEEIFGLYKLSDLGVDGSDKTFEDIQVETGDKIFIIKSIDLQDYSAAPIKYTFLEIDEGTYLQYRQNQAIMKNPYDIYYYVDGNSIRFLTKNTMDTGITASVRYISYLPELTEEGVTDIYEYLQKHIVNSLCDMAAVLLKDEILRSL
jgi:hypothetical protein